LVMFTPVFPRGSVKSLWRVIIKLSPGFTVLSLYYEEKVQYEDDKNQYIYNFCTH
jgi:hypothetical protein